jgi:cytochrome P450
MILSSDNNFKIDVFRSDLDSVRFEIKRAQSYTGFGVAAAGRLLLYLFQIDDVLGDPTSGRKPRLEDSQMLHYVEATILELMRIETVTPQGLPRKTLNDAVVSGFFIPKGTMVRKHF